MSPFQKMVQDIRRLGYLPVHQIYKKRNQFRSASPASQAAFGNILSDISQNEPEVFVHVGLSDIKAAFDVNPYKYLLSELQENFESVIAPGFTDYFKDSGVYHRKYSRPKHGTFNKLFLDDAEYRTEDPIKSFLVKGPYRFNDCDHRDSYGENGCFEKLVEDNVLVLNIGVPWITCSHLHHFESAFDVPYMHQESFEGVIYYDDSSYEVCSHTVGEYISKYYSWNKPKIERILRRGDVLSTHNLKGLRVMSFHLQDLKKVIGEKLEENPYYLVTL